MELAALPVEADQPALAVGVVVLALRSEHGTDAGEVEGHGGDERPVAAYLAQVVASAERTRSDVHNNSVVSLQYIL
jgi:hypothetical protein